MAEKHPYISGSGGITSAINLLRKSFPSTVTADTLKKLGVAPNNESYVLNILRYIGVIDADGNKTQEATTTFSKHDDAEFQQAFEKTIRAAYKELFDLRGEDAWNLDNNALISFFRNSDQTSALVGKRQAGTFQALAALAGHGEVSAPRTREVRPKAGARAIRQTPQPPAPGTAAVNAAPAPNSNGGRDFGLTVRVEVNLPAAADQETYDKIFRSIRENLLNAK